MLSSSSTSLLCSVARPLSRNVSAARQLATLTAEPPASGSSSPVFTTYPAEYLREFTEKVFVKHGISPENAAIAAGVLSMSDLRGVDSHGVARLKTYHELLKVGRINPTPNIRVVRESPSTATVDGDNGLGLLVHHFGNEVAMKKAAEVGSGWVSAGNTNHYGIAAYGPVLAAQRGLIGISMTNTTRLVAPVPSEEPMLGTNPIAISFPGHKKPVVIDFATSAVAWGKVEIARRNRKKIPDGWGVDEHGHMTNDPEKVKSLLPLGSFTGTSVHKGYCLGAMVDGLCCFLSGANWGPFAPPFTLGIPPSERGSVGKGIGHFFGALRVDAFIDEDEFRTQVDHYREVFLGAHTADGNTMVFPGDPEDESYARRSNHGVPLVCDVVRDLREIATQLQITFD
eukprot:CAMPEP_0177647306 /NCGR_PEP_ID=MMETSP0447-20121125/10229_1 /TAXON_ID=0 /ORGANISM="Stygamoeba regulata, Strain BSH-02190019" /LENGTH=397 /DNA_ID=CAMNT_0019149881 /DNA_START=46 /DNA_END=1239 /DNA_ORIENTATION=-